MKKTTGIRFERFASISRITTSYNSSNHPFTYQAFERPKVVNDGRIKTTTEFHIFTKKCNLKVKMINEVVTSIGLTSDANKVRRAEKSRNSHFRRI